ncbi:MAG: helix-turn-helix domain-containing protein [Planctomycetes bacterium]|nr:helix-turn-helix domain-containing protein [Planctomycetota bacterium]
MELLNVKDVAARLRISQRQVWKLYSSGRIPAPVRISRSVRWREADIDRWVELGCPSRERFEAELVGGPKR